MYTMNRNMESALRLWQGFSFDGYLRSCRSFAAEGAGGDGDMYVADGCGGWGLAEGATALTDGPSCAWAHGLTEQEIAKQAPYALAVDLAERLEGMKRLEDLVHSIRAEMQRAAGEILIQASA